MGSLARSLQAGITYSCLDSGTPSVKLIILYKLLQFCLKLNKTKYIRSFVCLQSHIIRNDNQLKENVFV